MLFARDYGSRLLGGYLGENGPLLPQSPRKPLHHIVLIDRGRFRCPWIHKKKKEKSTIHGIVIDCDYPFRIYIQLILISFNINIDEKDFSKKMPLYGIFILF